ncbi:MAG: hypothetical protein BWY40_01105 [bacterium ADurb.Bin270]|nr:MAG: hypothetical protein BWY40_01105 [bacterium ADurb.Bin270]
MIDASVGKGKPIAFVLQIFRKFKVFSFSYCICICICIGEAAILDSSNKILESTI